MRNSNARNFSPHGFTMVELLVVIGVIALLISILIPSILRSRVISLRIVDVSNLRHLAEACNSYHNDWKCLPRGNRLRRSAAKTSIDDLRWINNEAFAALLRYTKLYKEAEQWEVGSSSFSQNVPLSYNAKKIVSCTSLFRNERALEEEVGRVDKKDVPELTATMLGYNYWGGRDDALTGQIYQPNGAVVPGDYYHFMTKLKDNAGNDSNKPTSTVLFSCPNYFGPMFWGYELPHASISDSLIRDQKDSDIDSPIWSASTRMRGMCFSFADGHAEWIPRSGLWSIHEGDNYMAGAGYQWIYFPGRK